MDSGRPPFMQQHGEMRNDDFPIDFEPDDEAGGDLLGLTVSFQQQPSTSDSAYLKSQAQKSRPKGRKSEKPIKLSQRRSNSGEEKEREELNADAFDNETEFQQEENSGDGDGVIKKIKWDISARDPNKDLRKQTGASGTSSKEDSEAQSPFTCISCHMTFDQAVDYMSHACSHNPGPELFNNVQGDVLNNGLSQAVGKNTDTDETVKLGRVVGDKMIYNCPVCEAAFSDLFQFNLHREEAHQEEDALRRYECQSCGKTFLGKRVLNQHYKRSHPDEKNYSCPVCNESFPTFTSLNLHKRNHVGYRPFKCNADNCDRAFPDVASLNRHLRTHSEDRPHICQHCGKGFKMQNHLREHTRLHTGEKPYVCEICGAGFAQSNGLRSHSRQHLLDQGNQCTICNKVFSHPQFLELHKRNHGDEKPYPCDVCGQNFRTTTNLGAHKRLKHDIVNRKGTNVYTCDVCASTFASAAELSTHKKIHGGEKPFNCDLCDQTFRTPANLGAHRKLKHEMDNKKGEKLFTCDICGASFSQACNLGIHKKKKHIDSHSSERKYVCDICDARFSEPCNLGAHKKIKHSEESEDGRTIFECDICAAKFYRACNLSGHKRRKHGDLGDRKEIDKPFVCEICHARYSSEDHLQEHQSKLHFSMPQCFTDKKSAFNPAKPPQQTTGPSGAAAFDNPKQSTVGKNLPSPDIQEPKFSQRFPKSEHQAIFPSTSPASTKREELPHHDSYMNHNESNAASPESNHAHNSSRAFVTPGCDVQNKMSFDQPPMNFQSRLPMPMSPSMHNFPFGMRPSACHMCGAIMPDERSLLQHLEMHSNERYFQDVFSAQ